MPRDLTGPRVGARDHAARFQYSLSERVRALCASSIKPPWPTKTSSLGPKSRKPSPRRRFKRRKQSKIAHQASPLFVKWRWWTSCVFGSQGKESGVSKRFFQVPGRFSSNLSLVLGSSFCFVASSLSMRVSISIIALSQPGCTGSSRSSRSAAIKRLTAAGCWVYGTTQPTWLRRGILSTRSTYFILGPESVTDRSLEIGVF